MLTLDDLYLYFQDIFMSNLIEIPLIFVNHLSSS